MELLEQCQRWCDEGDYQKIIDALEAVPAENRTPEMDSELARGYIAIAGEDDREPYEKAIALLEPHADYFKGDHCWNYRMASAWYYLGQYGTALRYFEQALEGRPDDEDTRKYITTAGISWPCRSLISPSGSGWKRPGPLLQASKQSCAP